MREHDSFGPATMRRGRRKFDDDEPDFLKRGRLEPHLAEEPDLPETGDNWSTWDGALHGPTPRPDWVRTEHGAVDDELGMLKTGKEADVHLLERAVPGTERRVLMAAKRYRTNEHKLFHRDAGYLEGRRVRRSREMRAMTGRTAFGRDLLAGQWAGAEFAALATLWSDGVAVPYPVQCSGTEVLLEFVTDGAGSAASRLAQLRPDPEPLGDLWHQLTDALLGLARRGWTHGDLSAFNVLVAQGRLVLIDLPQVVDVVGNPNGPEFLARDVRRIGDWFVAHSLSPEIGQPEQLLAELRREVGITGG